jgi:hypothetical protein
MGKKERTRWVTGEAAVQRLAEDLRTKTSPKAILKCLKELSKGLEDPLTGDNAANVFLRAGGLPTLIGHLGGNAPPLRTTDPLNSPYIPLEVAKALATLMGSENVLLGELRLATGVITPLIATLRDGPNVLSRSVAANALLGLVASQPETRKDMAEGGVTGLLLQLCIDVRELPPGPEVAKGLAALARTLLESEPLAARDLEQAIRAQETVQSFGALLLLEVCL